MTQSSTSSSAYKTPGAGNPTLSLLGLQLVKAQVSADEANDQLSIYEAVQEPGCFIPLHSHPEVEWMYILEGTMQVLAYREGSPYWMDVTAGESFVVPSNARHALRNSSNGKVRLLCITLGSMGRFFEEVGRPVLPNEPLPVPTMEWKQEFFAKAISRGYWMGSLEENAAIGIQL